MSLKAVIFDCDGVIADDEMVHLAAFRETLAPLGITISDNDYYDKYLGFSDVEAIDQALIDNDKRLSPAEIDLLAKRKAEIFRAQIARDMVIYPGVVELVHRLRSYALAVASGALREEIELILSSVGLQGCFEVIVSAESVSRGKPDPEPFLTALRLLKQYRPLSPAECLVIEDSVAGVEAARKAGMWCLAVTNSYAKEKLAGAHMIVETLERLDVRSLAKLCEGLPRAGAGCLPGSSTGGV